MTITFDRIVPLLRIFDLVKAKEFYVDFLGMTVEWEHRFEGVSPVYLCVSRGNLMFHLTEHHGDCSPGTTVFVQMTGVREYHAELRTKDYPYNRPGIEDTFYGATAFQVHDPFGNRIRFNEYHKPGA